MIILVPQEAKKDQEAVNFLSSHHWQYAGGGRRNRWLGENDDVAHSRLALGVGVPFFFVALCLRSLCPPLSSSYTLYSNTQTQNIWRRLLHARMSRHVLFRSARIFRTSSPDGGRNDQSKSRSPPRADRGSQPGTLRARQAAGEIRLLSSQSYARRGRGGFCRPNFSARWDVKDRRTTSALRGGTAACNACAPGPKVAVCDSATSVAQRTRRAGPRGA